MFNCWSLLYGDNAEMLLDQGKMRVGCAEMVLVHVEMRVSKKVGHPLFLQKKSELR